MNGKILRPNRHNGMQESFVVNYGSEQLTDEEQAEETAEAEMGTD